MNETTEALEARRAQINAQRDALRDEAAVITAELNRRAAAAAIAKRLDGLTEAEKEELRAQLGA